MGATRHRRLGPRSGPELLLTFVAVQLWGYDTLGPAFVPVRVAAVEANVAAVRVCAHTQSGAAVARCRRAISTGWRLAPMAGALRRGDTARVTEFLISFQRPPGLLAVELRAWLGSHARRFDAISGSLSCRADATP